MVEINGEMYYTPMEVALENKISSARGTSSYAFVVRQIKTNKLEAVIANDGQSKIPRYLVSEAAITAYNHRLVAKTNKPLGGQA